METPQEKINLFRTLFNGRADAYGEGDGLCVKQTVTDDVLKLHLTGKRRIGRYPLSPDILNGTGTWWAVVDIDNGNLNAAIELVTELREIDIHAYIEASKSKGFHVWVFFAEPVEAVKARALVGYAVNGSAFEVFPKQDSLQGIDFGNYVNLPLFKENVEEGKTVFLDPTAGYEPYIDQWEALNQVQKVEPKKLEDLIESGEIEVIPGTTATESHGKRRDKAESAIDYAKLFNSKGAARTAALAKFAEGSRTKGLTQMTGHWDGKGILVEEAVVLGQDWDSRNEKPLDTDSQYAKYIKDGGKVSYTVRDIYKRNAAKASQGKAADSVYFERDKFIPPRLADELMEEFSFVNSGGLIYVYTDGVYQVTGTDFIREECRKRLADGSRINRLNEVVAHIVDLTRIDPDSLNTHKELINVENGMLQWRTGELLPHEKKYLSTMRIPVAFNDKAKCNEVDMFLMSTLEPDCIEIAEELFGYALIPDSRFHKAFMMTGSGANGKSTLLSLLEDFIGSDNTCKIPIQELCDNRFKRADLYGKLLNIFADLDNNALRSTSYFKTVASGDAIDAERKHQDAFYFRPFARMVFSANEIPNSKDTSFAYYRRWCILPFPNQFTGDNADKSILDKITQPEELSGLLNHALKGLRRLFQQGDFSESKSTQRALEDYEKANDSVAAFISDKCTLDSESEIERGQLFDSYTIYCEREGYKQEKRNAFYQKIRSRGILPKRLSTQRLFMGISV